MNCHSSRPVTDRSELRLFLLQHAMPLESKSEPFMAAMHDHEGDVVSIITQQIEQQHCCVRRLHMDYFDSFTYQEFMLPGGIGRIDQFYVFQNFTKKNAVAWQASIEGELILFKGNHILAFSLCARWGNWLHISRTDETFAAAS